MTSRRCMKYLYCKEKGYMRSEQSRKTGTLGSHAIPTGRVEVRPGGGSPGPCPCQGCGWVWAVALGESAGLGQQQVSASSRYQEDLNQGPLHRQQGDLGCPKGSGQGLHSYRLLRGNTEMPVYASAPGNTGEARDCSHDRSTWPLPAESVSL